MNKKLPAEILTVFIGRGFCFPTQLIFKLVFCTQMYRISANANLVVLCTSHSGLVIRRGGLVLAFLVCFALFCFVFNFCYQWAGFTSNAKGCLSKSFPTIPWEMEPFYVLKSILNHHCTVWWYSLYFRKLVLSYLSKPGDAREEDKKPR